MTHEDSLEDILIREGDVVVVEARLIRACTIIAHDFLCVDLGN